MGALILERPGKVSLSQTPVPTPGPGEVLIRVRAATTCGTDLKAFVRGHPQIPMPGVFGHEYAGEVAEVGEGAPFRTGENVMGVHSAPCQTCRWCLAEQENLCESIMATKVLGSFAEFLLIPAHIAKLNLYLRPASLPLEQASLLEPLSCVTQALSLVNLRHVQSALVIGPGAVGLMFVALLKLKGIEVDLVGRSDHRLQVGEALGAKPLSLDEAGGSYDLVVECTGAVEIWERSIGFPRRGGTVILFGGCPTGTTANFDTARLHYDQISLISPFHFGTAAVREARDLLVEGKLDLSNLITGSRSLAEGPQTMEDLRAGKGIKYVFRP